MPTRDQNRAIHAMRRACGIEDGDYRGLLQDRFGVGSSRDLSARAAVELIRVLRASAPPKPHHADGPWRPILRALWIAAWNLQIIDDRTDAALDVFCARQTGLASARWLIEARAAQSCIEALKSMCTRAGVVWAPARDPLADKKEICRAVWQLARDAGVWSPVTHSFPSDLAPYAHAHGLGAAWGQWIGSDYDAIALALGAKIHASRKAAIRKAAVAKAAAAKAMP